MRKERQPFDRSRGVAGQAPWEANHIEYEEAHLGRPKPPVDELTRRFDALPMAVKLYINIAKQSQDETLPLEERKQFHQDLLTYNTVLQKPEHKEDWQAYLDFISFQARAGGDNRGITRK